MNKEQVLLEHILENIQHLRDFIAQDGAKEAYENDWLVQAGILRTLQTMSESTQRLSASFKHNTPQVPWQDISDFRNILVHGYLGDIDVDMVWKIIHDDLSPLEEAVSLYYQRNYKK